MMNVTGWPPMGAPRLRARSFNITDSKAILQRCENEEIGEVLARECGRNRTL